MALIKDISKLFEICLAIEFRFKALAEDDPCGDQRKHALEFMAWSMIFFGSRLIANL